MANGIVYVDSNGEDGLYALDALTGAYLGSFHSIGGTGFSPTVVKGVISFTSPFDRKLYALNANTGAQIWQTAVGNNNSNPLNTSPAVVGGKVYVGSNDNNVYALDAATGTVIWKYPTGDSAQLFFLGSFRWHCL